MVNSKPGVPFVIQNSRFVSKIPGFSFAHGYVIIRSAINLHTTTRDQFPLEIFVFGKSIPVLLGYNCSLLATFCKFICYFLRSFGFKMMFSAATGEHPSFLSTSSP